MACPRASSSSPEGLTEPMLMVPWLSRVDPGGQDRRQLRVGEAPGSSLADTLRSKTLVRLLTCPPSVPQGTLVLGEKRLICDQQAMLWAVIEWDGRAGEGRPGTCCVCALAARLPHAPVTCAPVQASEPHSLREGRRDWLERAETAAGREFAFQSFVFTANVMLTVGNF